MAAKKNIAAENGTAANRRVVLVGTYKGGIPFLVIVRNIAH